MLELFGIKDNWIFDGLSVLPQYGSQVYTISWPFVFSSCGIIGLDSNQVIEDTLDHTDSELDLYQRHDSYELQGLDGNNRLEGGVLSFHSPSVALKGRYLSLLLGNYSNHFHWLLMNLSRISILNSKDLEDLSGILIPDDLSASQLEALNLAGLERYAPFYGVRRGDSLRVETLVLPWNVASSYGINPDALEYLRNLVAVQPKNTETVRKIYVDRRNSPLRRLVNEDEIVESLRREGFKAFLMEKLSLFQQIRLFQQAETIVSPHGAGLSNIAFSAPGTRVIEMLPSGNLNWCYRTLASACRHEYDCVIGRSHPDHSISPLWAPWTVSPTYVLSALLP